MQNLWAEDTNHEIAEKTDASVGTRFIASSNTALPTDRAIVSSVRAWLLSDYIAPYCRALAATRIFRRCFFIDALGGTRAKGVEARFIAPTSTPLAPNIFDDLAEAEQNTLSHEKPRKGDPRGRPPRPDDSRGRPPGPPILQPVASLAQELASENKPITLQGIILEGRKGKAKTTVGTRFIASTNAVPAFTLPKESALLNAHWRNLAPALLPAIEQFATIFLLNPLSPPFPREAPFFTYDDLVPFYQRTAPTELCLLITHKHIENSLLPALRTPPGAAAFTSLLRSDRWKPLLSGQDNIATTINTIINLFQAAIQPHFLAVQRIAFPMPLGPASVEDAPISLLFATRRQDSLICMNDAVCSYRRRLEEQSLTGILNEAWFREQRQARLSAALQNLNEDTLRLGRSTKPRRWPDLRQQLLIAHFGQSMLRDYDEIILNLLQTGAVRCDWKQPPIAVDNSTVGTRFIASSNTAFTERRIPGSEDTLLWTEKKRRY